MTVFYDSYKPRSLMLRTGKTYLMSYDMLTSSNVAYVLVYRDIGGQFNIAAKYETKPGIFSRADAIARCEHAIEEHFHD